MANQNLPISGLHPLTGALTPNDLMIISQEQPEGWESFHVEVEKFVTLVIAGMNDGSVFLRKVHTIDSSGLIGSGTIPDALGLDWDYLRTQFAPNDVGDAYVTTTTRLIAGNGLSGGGALNTDRTIALGTPSTLTATTTNESNGDTHTHELSKASTTVAGVVKLVDNTNSDSVTEAVTAKVAKNLATTKADKNIALTAGAGLTGGGDLSAGRTISLAPPGTLTETSTNTASVDTHTHRINPATKDSAGIVRIDDVLDSSSTSVAASSRAVKLLNDNKAEKSTAINAGSGLTGGGNLNASRTLQVDFNTLDARYALSGVGGSYVPLTRTIATGAGLTGGGDLSANRTIGINFGVSAGTVAMGNDSRINNGQTAFSWGNHADQSYLKTVALRASSGLLGNGTVAANGLGIDYTVLNARYLPLTGGTITGDLTINGKLNAAGLDTGIPIGAVMWFNCYRGALPDGWVALDGQLLTRTAFPDLWAMVRDKKVPTVTESFWATTPTSTYANYIPFSYRNYYTVGDGESTFRIPDTNGVQTGSIKSPFLRGDGKADGDIGFTYGDSIRNITGTFDGNTDDGNTGKRGAFYYTGEQFGGANGANSWSGLNGFDASRVVPTSNENTPASVFGVMAIKARGGTASPIAGAAPATTTANTFNGSQKIVGNLEVTGTEIVKDLVVTGSFNLSGSQKLPGTALASCNFNGVYQTFRYSDGIASITHLGDGLYEGVLNNPMPDANYAVLAIPSLPQHWDGPCSATVAADFTQTTTRFRVRVSSVLENYGMPTVLNIAIFR